MIEDGDQAIEDGGRSPPWRPPSDVLARHPSDGAPRAQTDCSPPASWTRTPTHPGWDRATTNTRSAWRAPTTRRSPRPAAASWPACGRSARPAWTRSRALAAARLRRMASLGVTTVECKSGYGLDEASERRQLEAVRDVSGAADLPRVVPTYLALHAASGGAGGDRDAYAARGHGLVAARDRRGRPGPLRRRLRGPQRLLGGPGAPRAPRARELGLGVRLHAGQFADVGGAELGAELARPRPITSNRWAARDRGPGAAAGVRAVLLPPREHDVARRSAAGDGAANRWCPARGAPATRTRAPPPPRACRSRWRRPCAATGSRRAEALLGDTGWEAARPARARRRLRRGAAWAAGRPRVVAAGSMKTLPSNRGASREPAAFCGTGP